MCHQVIQIYGCGHSRPSRAVRCRNPTSKCGGIFLRQELENIRGLCISCRRASKLKSAQQQRRTAVTEEDEGYFS
ncbi:hypothetical protein V8E51_010430 [Hyaloscypha variabilis]